MRKSQGRSESLRATAAPPAAAQLPVSSVRGPRLQRIVRWPLFLGSVVLLVLATVAGRWLHDWQVQRMAQAFVVRASQLEQEQRYSEAVEYLERYLRLHPNDTAAKIHAARAFDHVAQSPESKLRAVALFYRAANAAAAVQSGREETKAPEFVDLQVRLAELLLDVERPKSAEELASELTATAAANARALRVLALAQFAQLGSRRTSADVVAANLEKAVAALPSDVELATRLAEVYREHLRTGSDEERIGKANRVMDGLVSQSPNSAEAFLARYRYRLRYAPAAAVSDSQEDADLARAVALAPTDPAVLSAAAEHALRRNAVDEAEQLLRKLIASQPKLADGYDLLARVEQLRGNNEAAMAVLREGLSQLGSTNLQLGVRLLELLVDVNELEEAKRISNELRSQHEKQRAYLAAPVRTFWQHNIDLAESLWFIKSDLPDQAVKLLTPITVGGTPEQRMRASTLLGTARLMLNQPVEASAAFERASSFASDSGGTTLAAAEALLALGRTDQAIQLYRQLLLQSENPEIWYRLARAAMWREARRSPATRDWALYREAFQKARGATSPEMSESWRLSILEVNRLLLDVAPAERNQRLETVYPLLKQTEERYPESASLKQELVGVYAQLGRWEDADRVLAAWSKSAGNALPVIRTRAVLAQTRGQPDEAREILVAAIEGDSARDSAEVIELRRTLAGLLLRQRQLDEARRQWQAILKTAPNDVAAIRSLLESMIATTEPGPTWEGECQEWERRLEEIEGKDSANVRFFRACRAIRSAKGATDPRLKTAEELLAQLQAERPGWAAVATLRGLLREQQGRLEEALKAYEEAIRLGERRLVAFERQLALLYRFGRTDEAEKLLQQLGDSVAASTRLSSLAILESVRNQETDVALSAARRGVAARPADPVAWMWLASLLDSTADAAAAAEAEQAYRKAVQLLPRDLRAWQLLIAYYGRRGDKDALRRTIEQLDALARTEQLPTSEYQLVAASVCELLGDAAQLETRLQAAVQAAPADARVLMAVAGAYLRREDPRAEATLRKVVELSPTWGDARRLLANYLAARGPDPWKEARDLLSRPEPDARQATYNRRMLAILLAQRGEYEEAERLLTLLVDDEDEPGDLQELPVLAKVLEAVGKIDAAEQRLTELATRLPLDADHLVMLAEFLLRHERLAAFDRWLADLDTLEPAGWRGAALRARWLKAQGKDPEVTKLVDAHVETQLRQDLNPDNKARVLRQAGDLYTALRMHPAAERWYRELLLLDPNSYASLGRSIARQGRVDEAIDLFVKMAAEDASNRPARGLALVLAEVPSSEEQFTRAWKFLSAAETQHRDDASYQLALANLVMARGQAEQAIERYRRLLQKDANQPLALNNLAFLLGEKPETRQEALRLVDQAIALNKGPNGALLDTKGTILLSDGKVAEALPLLERAADPQDADPRNRLHLAAAYLRSGNQEKAKQVYRSFKAAVVDERLFTPGERQMTDELDQAFPELAASK